MQFKLELRKDMQVVKSYESSKILIAQLQKVC